MFFPFLCWRPRNRKKEKIGKGQKNPIKISFLRWSPRNVKNRKIDFSKNRLTRFVSGRKKNAHFRAHYLFWPKCFLDQNNVNQKAL